MAKPWLTKRQRELFYRKAKEKKYRARSAYKLIEINKRFRLIKPRNVIVDLGAAPGSWSQVALRFVGEHGFVLGVDIIPVAPLPSPFHFLKADLTKAETATKIKKLIPRSADIVLSDVAPEFSGIRIRDIGIAMSLSTASFKIAKKILKKGGHFICKVFLGKDFQLFITELKKNFKEVRTVKPSASLKESAEMYVVARGFKS